MLVVIRAGGLGSRLWPMSRQAKPKQFWSLLTTRTLLEDAYALYRPQVARADQLFVSVGAPFVSRVRRLLPRLPRENIIAEPVSRNTGPAVGLESVVLRTRFPGADPVVASVTCDDVFPRGVAYQTALRQAARWLTGQPGAIIAVANRSTGPDPGLSYLKVGRVISRSAVASLHPVVAWIEKPVPRQLGQLLNSPRTFAHTGQYLWRLSTVLDLLAVKHPHLWPRFERIGRAWLTRRRTAVLEREYPRLPSLSLEQFITQVAPRVVATCGDFGWSDTGKWFLIHRLLTDGHGNAFRGKVVAVDTERSLIFADRRVVATLGLRDAIVVETEDALLVTTRAASGRVKELVEELGRLGFRRLL